MPEGNTNACKPCSCQSSCSLQTVRADLPCQHFSQCSGLPESYKRGLLSSAYSTQGSSSPESWALPHSFHVPSSKGLRNTWFRFITGSGSFCSQFSVCCRKASRIGPKWSSKSCLPAGGAENPVGIQSMKLGAPAGPIWF